MEDVLNATIAGGVTIGASSNLMVNPAVSILVGFIGGFFSAFGFNF